MEANSEPGIPRRTLNAFLCAVQFLLVSPAFVKRPFTTQELGASVGFFPLVGLILGVILIGAETLLDHIFPPLVRSALILAVWVALTGALHLDGFLDTCDGLLGGYDAEQRLRIMRDERVGAYAFAGGALLLLVKFSALSSLGNRLLPALLLAPSLGRGAITAALVAYPYARSEGLGKEMKENASSLQVWVASMTVLALAVGLTLWVGSLVILFALISAGLTAWLVVRFSLQRLPGLTGDIYGSINELVELSVLLVMSTLI
jgi:adenosylcobinamide-GDP ribazoletransferase